METVELGRTGRSVSRLGFGGATAGLKNYLGAFDPRDRRDRETLVAAMKRALALGVTYFDTAAGYGDGASEEIFGEGLDGVPAESVFLATKVAPMEGGAARASLERSLRLLRRDFIDLIQIHGSYYAPEGAEEILGKGGMLEALERARDEGLVRYIGFSVECQNEALYRFVGSGRFDTLQVQYNLLFQHPYDPSFTCGSLYEAERAGLGVITMRSLTSGIFQRWVQKVNPENAFDYTPALLQFVLSNPFVDVALVGMRTPEEVERNVGIVADTAGRIDLDRLHQRYV